MPLAKQVMASTSKKLLVDLCFMAILVFQIPKGEATHDVQQSHNVHSRRSLNHHPLLSLLDNNSVELNSLESVELHQQNNRKRDRSRYDLSYERHQNKDHENRQYKNRLDNDRHHRPHHHHQSSVYDNLAPYVSHKNLLALQQLLGDERNDESRHQSHKDNNHRENRHNQNWHDKQSNRYDDFSLNYSEERHRSQKRKTLLQLLNREDNQALRYRNDDRNRRPDDRDRRDDDRDQSQENRDRRDNDRDRRQDNRDRRQDDRDRTLDDIVQRPRDKYKRLDYRYKDKSLENKQHSYNRYVDEYNKRYRGRYDYKSRVQAQNTRPRRVQRLKRYNNLRTRLEKLDQKDHEDQRYESRLKSLRARLSKNLLNLDQSPVKSLLRAADDLDCAAQLQCIKQCNKKPKQKPAEKKECSQTCEEEIECEDDEEEDLCNESGHNSCEKFGTGSTKGELLELENNDCC